MPVSRKESCRDRQVGATEQRVDIQTYMVPFLLFFLPLRHPLALSPSLSHCCSAVLHCITPSLSVVTAQQNTTVRCDFLCVCCCRVFSSAPPPRGPTSPKCKLCLAVVCGFCGERRQPNEVRPHVGSLPRKILREPTWRHTICTHSGLSVSCAHVLPKRSKNNILAQAVVVSALVTGKAVFAKSFLRRPPCASVLATTGKCT